MITTWSSGGAEQYMAEGILTELAGTIRRHPWWQARADFTLRLLDRAGVRPPAGVLDAGCGWGVTLERLERQGYRVTGLDVSRRCLEALDRPDRRLIEADLTRDWPHDRAARFDAVLALDVIEHLDDDQAAVSRLARLVRPGGLVVVSVPAHPEFFSEFDAIQGHRRRYEPERLRQAFDGSGLVVERIVWWANWLIPLLRRQRSQSRAWPGDSASQTYQHYLKLPPWPIPALIRLRFAAECGQAVAGRLSDGTSLFALARGAEPVSA